VIRHLVLVRFRDVVPAAERDEILADLAALSDRLDGILDFGAGRNVSPEEPVVHGLRDVFWFDFRDAAARDAYLADSLHQAIGARLVAAAEGGLAGLVVCDLAL
jgi:hypothetical protein